MLYNYLATMKKILVTFIVCICSLGTFALAGAPSGFGDDVLQDELKLQGTDKLQLDSWWDGKILAIVKWGINWVLGILGLIALVVAMVGGFFMVTASGNEEQFNRGWQYLKAAIVGIILIWLAWFVASLIFWLVNIIGGEADGATAETNS